MLETAQFPPAWLAQQQARIRQARYDPAAITREMQELSQRSVARAKAQMRDMQQESASFDQY